MNRFLRVFLAAFALSGLLTSGHAQDWPSRPVTVIYPWPPGGGTDAMMRMVADRLSRELGQQFVLDVRAGASGTIGSDMAARAKPDGYTLVMSGLASHVIAPAYTGTAFDPIKDFTHIALIGGSPIVLAVHPGFEANSLKEYVDLSRSKSNGIAIASSGAGSFAHLMAERFRQLSGGNLVYVPYKGLPPAHVDLIAGHIPSAMTTLGASGSLVHTKKIRLLAVSTAKRLPTLPDVPTFAEAGYGDLLGSTWFSLSGPAGLPPAVVAMLNAKVRSTLADPAVYERLTALGMGIEPRDLRADAFTDFVRAEIERWAPLARAAKSTAAPK